MVKRLVVALLVAVLVLPTGTQEFVYGSTVYEAERREEIPNGYEAVYTVEDLYEIRNNLSGNYILMNDIDMSEATSEGGDYDCGTGWEPIEGFRGTLDGNGYRIIGMHIFGEFNRYGRKIGLFGEVASGAVVSELGMVNCDIDVTLSSSYIYIGSIAGQISSGDIINCYSSGTIKVEERLDEEDEEMGAVYIGGLVGRIPDSHYGMGFLNCYNKSSIECNVTGNQVFTGGICGGIGEEYETQIAQCYNAGTVKGSTVGAICGDVPNAVDFNIFQNCMYLRGTTEQGVAGVADGTSGCRTLTEAQMKSKTSFTGYDFTETWETDPYCGYAYPQLKMNRMIRVKSVNLITAPAKLVYNQGEALSIGDSVLEVEYEDGIKTSVPLSLDMLDGYDMMQIGRQTVSVAYGGAETSFDIEVKEIPVSSITLPETISIYRSKEQRLNPVILPVNASDKSVTWESSAPSIASVDSSGLVRAMAKGTAVITATSANGLVDRCTVTVLVPAVSIQLSQTSLILKEGENKNITAQVLPLESTDTAKWRSGNPTVAEVYDGTIVAKKAGTAAITVYTDSGVQAVCTVTVQKPVTVLIRKTQAEKAKIKSIKNVKTKSIKLKLSGVSGYDGYQIQYGLKKNFKSARSIKQKSSFVTIKKLKAKKTYYVRVRVYKKIAGKTYYGKWSGKKTVRIKK